MAPNQRACHLISTDPTSISSIPFTAFRQENALTFSIPGYERLGDDLIFPDPEFLLGTIELAQKRIRKRRGEGSTRVVVLLYR